MSSPSTDPTPPPIPDYELIRLVGRGSYGDVWLAKGATGLFRAVKVVWRARFDDATPYEREFNGLREFARITAGESRQLALLHVGRNNEDGFFYYVMELADDVVTGSDIDPDCYAPLTLKVLRDREDFLPAAAVIRYGMDLAADLADLHSHGLIHRDIKPSNIIVVGGRPKLADIGLVAVADQALTYVGTEGFVPPEGPGTVSADIYSFGKVLYELATGRDRQDFPRLPENLGEREDRAELMELNEIIVKAAAPTPAQRYASAETLLGELQLLNAGKSVRRLRFAEAGLARARKWILAAVAIATIAGTGVYFERQRADTESAGRRAAEAQLAELTRRTLYLASINNAQTALAVGDIADARQELAKAVPAPGEPDLRRFEWHALKQETEVPGVRTLRESGDLIDVLIYSPDGSLLAAKEASDIVSIYELDTGELWRRHRGVHRLVGFTPDGARLVGSTPDYGLETWDIDSGAPDPRPSPPGIHRPIRVAEDAARLLYYRDSTTEAPHHVAVRDLTADEDLVAQPVPRFLDQGKWEFFHAMTDGRLTRAYLQMMHGKNQFVRYRLWDLPLQAGSGPLRFFENLPHRAIAADAARQELLLFRELDGYSVMKWNAKTRTTIWEYPLADEILDRVLISPDRRWVALSLFSRKIAILDWVTGEATYVHQGISDRIQEMDWAPDSRQLAISSLVGEIQLLPLEPPRHPWRTLQAAPLGKNSTGRILINRQEPMVLAYDGTTRGEVIDLRTGEVLFSSPIIREAVFFDQDEIWFLDDEQRLAHAKIEELKQETHTQVQDLDFKFFMAVTSANGAWLAATSTEEELVLWDLEKQRVVNKTKVEAGLYQLCVDDQGIIFASTLDQHLLRWDARTDSRKTSPQFLERFGNLRISPDQKWLAATANSFRAVIFNTEDFSIAKEMKKVAANADCFDFHPDGNTLVGAGSNGLVRIWDIDGWRERPSLQVTPAWNAGTRQAVRSVIFTPDGRMLLAQSQSGILRAWRW